MSDEHVIAKKKLIEVALPLEAINKASAREKSIRHGHPSTLHLWWARRPLAAARAVIFAQMVDDPSANPDLFPTERAQDRERQAVRRQVDVRPRLPRTEHLEPRLLPVDREHVAERDPLVEARLALERLGATAPRTAFLDDVPTNVTAAQSVGMLAVLVDEDPTDAVRTVRGWAGLDRR